LKQAQRIDVDTAYKVLPFDGRDASRQQLPDDNHHASSRHRYEHSDTKDPFGFRQPLTPWRYIQIYFMADVDSGLIWLDSNFTFEKNL
jgi:hypothetical protein